MSASASTVSASTSLDKMVKAVDSLKSSVASTGTASHHEQSVRERVEHCRSLTEPLCSANFASRASPGEVAKYLSVAFEALFALCDDPEPEVRMRAEESINRITRHLTSTNSGRVQVELYKEIKKNGPARCLRAALAKFAALVDLIRPQKCRAYVVNLVPALVKIARRKEDTIHDALASTVPKILHVLGVFVQTNEVKVLLKTYLVNLMDTNPAIRRATATCLVAIATCGRHAGHFVPWLLSTLLDFLVPLRTATSDGQQQQQEPDSKRIQGILLAIRVLLPEVSELKQEQKNSNDLVNRLLQVYELCLHYLDHADHNVLTHALETLNELLKRPPGQRLKEMLTSAIGFDHSYIQPLPSASPVEVSRSLTASHSSYDNLLLSSRLSTSLVLELSEEQQASAAAFDDNELLDNASEAGLMQASDVKVEILDAPTPKNNSVSEEPEEDDESAATETKSDGESLQPAAADEFPVMIPSPSSGDFLLVEEMPIGTFCDADTPLIYCARKVTARFLLSGLKGEEVPHSRSRTSAKVLAFSCLTSICQLHPRVYLLPLLTTSSGLADADPTAPLLRDLLSVYGAHSDPQVRGSVALLSGEVLRGGLAESGGDLELWFDRRRPDHVDMLEQLGEFCADDSGVVRRMLAAALRRFVRPMLLSSADSALKCAKLLDTVVVQKLCQNCSYWLLKIELCELIASVPFAALYYAHGHSYLQDKLKHVLLVDFLGDEDPRVRAVAARAIVRLIPNLYYQHDDRNNDPVIVEANAMAKRLLQPIVNEEAIVVSSLQRKHQRDAWAAVNISLPKETPALAKAEEARAFRVVHALARALQLAAPSHEMAGLCEAFSELSSAYPPVLHPTTWGIQTSSVLTSRNSANSSSSGQRSKFTPPGLELLDLVVQRVTSACFSTELVAHGHVLGLAASLFSGLIVQHLRSQQQPPQQQQTEAKKISSGVITSDQQLNKVGMSLLRHCVRVLCLFHHVLDDSYPPHAPAPTSTSSSAAGSTSSVSGQASLQSPGKKKRPLVGVGSSEGSGESSGISKKNLDDPAARKKMGYLASSSSHYLRTFDCLRSLHSVHKATLDDKHVTKMNQLLSACLKCLRCIFELSADNCLGKAGAEEVLAYLKTCLGLAPADTLKTVQSLLKCLFHTNLAYLEPADLPPSLSQRPPVGSSRASLVPNQRGLFYPCFDQPYNELVHCFRLARDLSPDRGEPGVLFQQRRFFQGGKARGSMFRTLGRSPQDRSELAAHIRLFESMVIRALKHYTLTSGVSEQSEVLRLLAQLVRLRVNYCLLDSDQIFVNYVIKQVQYIEEGQIADASVLLSEIFSFLVLLSYEKYHSRCVCDMAKIVRLCEGLFASGLDPEQYVLPALLPVAEDLFCYRFAADAASEARIEQQRLIVLNMLLKLIVYPAALEAVCSILAALKAQAEEDKWKKLSRTLTDVLIPLLANHKVRLSSKHSLDLLRGVFGLLAPGTMRPVDTLLGAMLTATVDLSDLSEVQCWLGFVVVSLAVLTCQSPEEGILGRLDELGIQIGGGQSSTPSSSAASVLLDTSMDSSSSTDPLGLGGPKAVKAEVTLAKFIIHVIGASCSKLHQCLYSHSGESVTFLSQELSHLLLFVSYMLQSGRYLKVSRAAQNLAKEPAADSVYDVRMISELFLQIGHAEPFLALQWLYILILLNGSSQSFWSRVLAPDQRMAAKDAVIVTKSSVIGLYPEILRTGGLVLYADLLCDNPSNVEATTWMLMNYIRPLLEHCEESPVQDFIMAIQSAPSSSGLLLQAVVSTLDRGRRASSAKLLRKALIVLESVHLAHLGKVLMLLANRFLLAPLVGLTKRANTLICYRLEMLLQESRDSILSSISLDEMTCFVEALRRRGDVPQRFPQLVSLVNRVATLAYGAEKVSPIESDELRTFNPEKLANVVVDRDWFLAQVRQRCCRASSSGEVCADLLASLTYREVTAIFELSDFQGSILPFCFRHAGRRSLIGRARPVLFAATRDALWNRLKTIVTEHIPQTSCIYYTDLYWDPTPADSRYRQRLEANFLSVSFRASFLELLDAFSVYLDCDADPFTNSDEEAVVDAMTLHLGRFAVLALEYVKWVLIGGEADVEAGTFLSRWHLQTALEAAAAALRNDKICAWLAGTGQQTVLLVSSAVLSLHVLLKVRFRLPSMNPKQVPEVFREPLDRPEQATVAILAAVQLQEMLSYLLDQPADLKQIAKDLYRPVRDAILNLCCMPVFTTYVRVPPRVWQIGWQVKATGPTKTLFPILQLDYFQDLDVLEAYALRSHNLGWSSRQQFEEVWVSLLGVISIGTDDLSDAEVKALSQCSVLVVQALTTLILRTMELPRPGSGVSKPIHYARDLPGQFLLSPRGQQLTAIQNVIQQSMEQQRPESSYLRVDCSRNLERSGQDDDAHDYGFGQVSLAYIMSAIRHFDDTAGTAMDIAAAENRSKRSSSSVALSLPFLLREESLQSSGLDVHSCLRFLFELYGQWLSPENETPLNLLTETVRSILMLSDLFTELAHFTWMASTFTELLRSHPAEDELLLPLLGLGVCKSVAIAGFPDSTPFSEGIERLRKIVNGLLKSGQLPSRLCGLHSLLYLLQSEIWPSPDDDMKPFIGLAVDYLNMYLQNAQVLPLGQSQQHTSLMWALAFYLVENFDQEIAVLERSSGSGSSSIGRDWCKNLVQLALSLASKSNTSRATYLLLLAGLERLVVSGKILGRALDQVIKLATDLLTEPNPNLVIPAIQLFVACMYHSAADSDGHSSSSRGLEDPEKLMLAMERMSILFDCVRRSGPAEAKLLCQILPKILVDFFPAADVINRVINEFISPGQPHQILLSGVLFSVFQQGAQQDQTSMLQEWVLMALPNFTQRTPLAHSIWCLSCFFISAANHNSTLQALYPQLQHRFGYLQHEDKKLFCLAAREFYHNLKNDQQRRKFVQTFESAASGEDEAASSTPYSDLMKCLHLEA